MVKDANYTTPEDTPLMIAAPGVLAGATDVENNTLTVVGHSAPAHGSVTVNPNGSFTYVPGPNGFDSFTANVSDGSGGYAFAIISIGVGG